VDVDATAVPLDGDEVATDGPDDAIKDPAWPERDAVYCSALLPTLLYRLCITPSTLFGVPSLL
jgi:hypothetical protein